MENLGVGNYTTRETCRVCGSGKLSFLFSLGNLYISTFVKNPGEDIGKAPLELVWCENCSLVQLKHTAPQELMYSKHYWYRSGLNKVIIDDLKEITEQQGIAGLIALPTIGNSIARTIHEIHTTGRSSRLASLRGEVEPVQLFCTIPGIGPETAMKIHQILHI